MSCGSSKFHLLPCSRLPGWGHSVLSTVLPLVSKSSLSGCLLCLLVMPSPCGPGFAHNLSALRPPPPNPPAHSPPRQATLSPSSRTWDFRTSASRTMPPRPGRGPRLPQMPTAPAPAPHACRPQDNPRTRHRGPHLSVALRKSQEWLRPFCRKVLEIPEI